MGVQECIYGIHIMRSWNRSKLSDSVRQNFQESTEINQMINNSNSFQDYNIIITVRKLSNSQAVYRRHGKASDFCLRTSFYLSKGGRRDPLFIQ